MAVENQQQELVAILTGFKQEDLGGHEDLVLGGLKKEVMEAHRAKMPVPWTNIESREPDGYTPLQQAVLDGDLDAVRELLACGANIDAIGIHGDTALHLAARYGHTEIVETLLAHAVNIEATNIGAHTALHMAAIYGQTEAATTLLAHGANIAAITPNAYTALHIAVEYEQTEIVKILLAHGANLEARIYGSFTALHLAASRGQTEIVRSLLAQGAYIESVARHTSHRAGYPPSTSDRTAVQIAILCDHVDVVDILLAAGAHTTAISRLAHFIRQKRRAREKGKSPKIAGLGGGDVNAPMGSFAVAM